MAIVSDIRVYPGTMLKSQDFAILAEKITPTVSGVLYGCTPTIKSSSVVHLSAGWVILRGRIIRVEDGDISAILPTSGTSTKYLVVKVDLSNSDSPCTITLEDSVGSDSSNFNVVNGTAYLSLGRLTISSSAVAAIDSIPTAMPTSASGASTSFTISTSNWSSSTSTVNGTAYYTYTVTLKNVSDKHPEVLCGPTSGTLPTAAETKAFGYVNHITVDADNLTMKLYATTKPTSNFAIIVKGVS